MAQNVTPCVARQQPQSTTESVVSTSTAKQEVENTCEAETSDDDRASDLGVTHVEVYTNVESTVAGTSEADSDTDTGRDTAVGTIKITIESTVDSTLDNIPIECSAINDDEGGDVTLVATASPTLSLVRPYSVLVVDCVLSPRSSSETDVTSVASAQKQKLPTVSDSTGSDSDSDAVVSIRKSTRQRRRSVILSDDDDSVVSAPTLSKSGKVAVGSKSSAKLRLVTSPSPANDSDDNEGDEDAERKKSS